MPHVILEYSANILKQEKESIHHIFPVIHKMLTQYLPTQEGGCKSRSKQYDTFYLGDGNTNNAFVYLELKICKGRSLETQSMVGEKLLAMLQQQFANTAKALKLDITVQVTELSDVYFSPWKQSTAKLYAV